MWWRRRESNPRPKIAVRRPAAQQPLSSSVHKYRSFQITGLTISNHLAVIRPDMRFCKTPISTRMNAARSNSRVDMAGSIGSIS